MCTEIRLYSTQSTQLLNYNSCIWIWIAAYIIYSERLLHLDVVIEQNYNHITDFDANKRQIKVCHVDMIGPWLWAHCNRRKSRLKWQICNVYYVYRSNEQRYFYATSCPAGDQLDWPPVVENIQSMVSFGWLAGLLWLVDKIEHQWKPWVWGSELSE